MPGTGEYGFTWGPMAVDRAMYVESRGRILIVAPSDKTKAEWTTWTELQVFMSEGGRRIRVWRQHMKRHRDGRVSVELSYELEGPG